MIHIYYSFILSYYSFLNILYSILYIVLSYSLSFPFTSFQHLFPLTQIGHGLLVFCFFRRVVFNGLMNVLGLTKRPPSLVTSQRYAYSPNNHNFVKIMASKFLNLYAILHKQGVLRGLRIACSLIL